MSKILVIEMNIEHFVMNNKNNEVLLDFGIYQKVENCVINHCNLNYLKTVLVDLNLQDEVVVSVGKVISIVLVLVVVVVIKVY